MHKKQLQELQLLKQKLTVECTYCAGVSCLRCSQAYDIYEQMAFAGLPPKYWEFTLDSLDPLSPGVEDVKKYVAKLPLAYKEGQGIFAHGKNGNGKTLCACIIAKEALKQGYTVRFTRLGTIISAFSQTLYDQSGREQLEQDILDVDFLIIDDVDKDYMAKDSKYIDSILDELFRTRADKRLPVIMTGNKTISDIFAAREGTTGRSLLSLFDENLLSILFMGKDHRAQIKAEARKKYLE